MKDNINIPFITHTVYLNSEVNFKFKLTLETLPFALAYIRPILNLTLTFSANLLLGYLVHKGCGVDCCGSGHGPTGGSCEGD